MDIIAYLISLIQVFGGVALFFLMLYKFPKLTIGLVILFIGIWAYSEIYSVTIHDTKYYYIMADGKKIEDKLVYPAPPGSNVYTVTRYYDHYVEDIRVKDPEGRWWILDYSVTGENHDGMRDPIGDIGKLTEKYVEMNTRDFKTSEQFFMWLKASFPDPNYHDYIMNHYKGMRNLEMIGVSTSYCEDNDYMNDVYIPKVTQSSPYDNLNF